MTNIRSMNIRYKTPHVIVRKEVAYLTVYPRIHMCGLDMSLQSGIMRSGSIGFSLTNIPVKIRVERATHDTIASNFSGGDNDLQQLLTSLRKYLGQNTHWHVRITYPPAFRPHIGIGSSTQVASGLVHCAARCLGITLTCEDLFRMGMGGASMLGLSLLHAPGFIIEYGYTASDKAHGRILQPALYNKYDAPTYSLLHITNCPWYAVVGIPRTFTSLSGSDETEFWMQHLPGTGKVAQSTTYSVLMDCIPGLIEEDFAKFTTGIHDIISQGTKPHEERLQNTSTTNALHQLREVFGVATVSSLGPTVYAFSEHDPHALIASLPSSDYQFVVLKLHGGV